MVCIFFVPPHTPVLGHWTMARDMGQWLKALGAIPETQSLVPSTHVRQLTTTCSRGADAFFLASLYT